MESQQPQATGMAKGSMALAVGVTAWAAYTYPPDGPLWRHFVWFVLVPLLWLMALVSQAWFRRWASDRYEGIRKYRVLATAMLVCLLMAYCGGVVVFMPTTASPAQSSRAISTIALPTVPEPSDAAPVVSPDGITLEPPAPQSGSAAAAADAQSNPPPSQVDEPRPLLADRYAESWDGRNGESIIITPSTVLPSQVGKQQMFTPAVRAPVSTMMSNVILSVCVPPQLKIDPVNPDSFKKEWTLQETTDCARYSTYFQAIGRGVGLNPREAIHFRPLAEGDYTVRYSIVSNELVPLIGSFVVRVKP